MENTKAKTQRLAAIVIVAFNIVGIGLILYDLANNISYEVQSQGQSSVVQEITPTPKATLTVEEREELFSQPVNEAGKQRYVQKNTFKTSIFANHGCGRHRWRHRQIQSRSS